MALCSETLQRHFAAAPCNLQRHQQPSSKQTFNPAHIWSKNPNSFAICEGMWNCLRQHLCTVSKIPNFFRVVPKTIRQQFVANHCNWLYVSSWRNTVDISWILSFCCRLSILYRTQNDISWFQVLFTNTRTYFALRQLLHLSRFVRFWILDSRLHCCYWTTDIPKSLRCPRLDSHWLGFVSTIGWLLNNNQQQQNLHLSLGRGPNCSHEIRWIARCKAPWDDARCCDWNWKSKWIFEFLKYYWHVQIKHIVVNMLWERAGNFDVSL